MLLSSPSLECLGYLKGIGSERGLGESHRSEEVTYFMAHLLPPLKALLNHNQITVDCQFLLARKPCSKHHSSQHSSLGIVVDNHRAGDYPVVESEASNLGALQPVSPSDAQHT